MTSKIMKHMSKAKQVVLFSAPILSVVGGVALNSVSADTVTAGGFDLTKQASEATFPVMFDRPSGVNAAALAATVRNLGTDSQLYKSAVASVPELADASKMSSLLADSLSNDASTKTAARTTIVKLINWYNSLGGTKITTQAGAAYTVDNLDAPINVLAVAFSNNSSINADVSKTIDQDFTRVRTVQDVMNILDKYAPGTSTGYKQAFDAYLAKYNAATDKSSVTGYAAVKPVLDSYENMYANGAAAIRKQLLSNQSASTEAGVAFFESAIISGASNSSDNGSSNTTPVKDPEVKTRWVSETGEVLSPEEKGTSYKSQKEFPGYTYSKVTNENGVRTYVYKKNTPAPKVTEDTVWVDESGKVLKEKTTGTHPDNDGKSDIPGYTLVTSKTTKDTDGNTHTVNTYRKIPNVTEDTVWVDESGKVLKEKTTGTHPDNDGKSDIPGYTLVSFKTTKDTDGNTHTVNVYRKTPTVTEDTVWVDEAGKVLKEKTTGTYPDNDGKSDIPGYDIVSTKTETDKDGNKHTVNIYRKTPTPTPKVTEDTVWVDESGKVLKEKTTGTYPDNDGKSDIPGYAVVSTKTTKDTDGNTHTVNVYRKTPTPKVTEDTVWVDESGKVLKEKTTGTHPDNDGKSDIPGYEVVSTKTTVDKDGNKHTVNVYRQLKPDTYWFDTEGVSLKDKAVGQTLPDNDGKSDIPGYELVRTYTVTEKDVNSDAFKGSTFKVGDTINIYKKATDAPKTPEKKSYTSWVEIGTNNKLQPDKDGEHPDNDGVSDIKGYNIVSTKKVDENGTTHHINYYEKVKAPTPEKKSYTSWLEVGTNTKLQADKDGEHPDNDGVSDINDYRLVRTDKVNENGVTRYINYYEKIKKPEVKNDQPKTPEKPKQELPKTGDAGSLATLVGAVSMAGGSAGLTRVLKKRKRK